MPKIKINPDEIEKLAGKMDRISQRLSKLAGQATSVGLSAPSYDGQLKPRVISLANQMNSQVMQGSARTLQGSGKLKTISDRFKQADFQTDRVQRFLADLLVPPWLQWICERHYKTGDQYLNSLLALGALGAGIEKVVLKTATILSPKNELTDEETVSKMARELKRFKWTKTGREMIKKAKDAGILFVLVDLNGNIIGQIGDPKTARKNVPIGWVENEGYSGAYNPGRQEIKLNQDYRNNNRFYKETLIHEMQHAIDDRNLIGEAYFANQCFEDIDLSKLSKEELRDLLEKEATIYVQTEVNSRDIGYEHGSGSNESKYGNILNRHDGIYTEEEYHHVLVTCDYSYVIKTEYERILKQYFPNGPEYSVTVFINDSGEIEVTLDEIIMCYANP